MAASWQKLTEYLSAGHRQARTVPRRTDGRCGGRPGSQVGRREPDGGVKRIDLVHVPVSGDMDQFTLWCSRQEARFGRCLAEVDLGVREDGLDVFHLALRAWQGQTARAKVRVAQRKQLPA